MSSSAYAEDSNWKFYLGLHGSTSQQSSIDPEGDRSNFWQNDKKSEPQKINNGDTKSGPSFSITGGTDHHIAPFGDWKAVKFILCGELFFDYINKAIVQNDSQYINSLGNSKHRPMANKPIYKTKYLTGLRGKAGIQLFERVSLYGHAGLTYWGRDLYVQIEDYGYWDLFSDGDKLRANWKIMPSWGIGATVNITSNWAVNANYMKVMPSTLGGLSYDSQGNNYNYGDGSIEIGIEVLTIGIQYYFWVMPS